MTYFTLGEWVLQGVCRTSGLDFDLWFEDTNRARELCGSCPVQDACLFNAMSLACAGVKIEGVWGGLSPIQIKRSLEQPSWRRVRRMRLVRGRQSTAA
jgi:hypothetical protein